MYVECRKKFLGVKPDFSVCVLGTVWFSDAVLGSVFAVSGCASMLVSVTFYVGMRGVWMLQGFWGRMNFARRRG